MKRTRAERLLVVIAGDDIAEEMIGSVESERMPASGRFRMSRTNSRLIAAGWSDERVSEKERGREEWRRRNGCGSAGRTRNRPARTRDTRSACSDPLHVEEFRRTEGHPSHLPSIASSVWREEHRTQ